MNDNTFFWHSIRMSWSSVELRRKYTQRTQDTQKDLWIGPRIGRPIFSTFKGCWSNQTSQGYSKIYYLLRWLVWLHQQHINVEKMVQPIQGPIQRLVCSSNITFYKWFLKVVPGSSAFHYFHLILKHVYNKLGPLVGNALPTIPISMIKYDYNGNHKRYK